MDISEDVLSRIDPRFIEAHLRFLSHPLLEGRAPGTRGAELAAEYIRAQFQAIGLEPVAGSYLQQVPLMGATSEPELAFTAREGEEIRPVAGDDYVAWAGTPSEDVAVEAPLLFAGFGITAPEQGWNDFKDADVSGKVLLIRVNDPGDATTPALFGGRALSYYGRWTYKFEEAARRGAAGALLLHTDESAGYGWQVVQSSNSREHFSPPGGTAPRLRLEGWLRNEFAARLPGGFGLALVDLLQASESREFRPVDTGITVRARVRGQVREVATANVMGCIPGTGGDGSDEVIILSSHYDHLGTAAGDDGERRIYHGAYDNASGVALLLSVAAAAAAAPRPSRSLLFLATTAEESGLLGAEWHASHPLVPLARTVAVLNVDGANLQGRTTDITPLGTDRSGLGLLVRTAAAAEGLEVRPEPHPEQGMFFRQDHFPFARAGVPALALDHGLDFEGRPAGWGEQWYKEFIANHYHQPSDAFHENFDYSGAVQQGRVMLRLALALGHGDERPDWAPDSEFQRAP